MAYNFNEDRQLRHEPFGLVELSRVSTNIYHKANMFGCDYHPSNVVQLRISKNNILGYDRVMGARPLSDHTIKDCIEINMSFSQWGELLSSMNYGCGVPCTVSRWGEERIEPYREPLVGQYEYEYSKLTRELQSQSEKYESAKKTISELIDKLPKKKQNEIMSVLSQLEKSITDVVPFLTKQAAEVSEKIVSKAKTEINAYMDMASAQLNANAAPQLTESKNNNLLITEFHDITEK